MSISTQSDQLLDALSRKTIELLEGLEASRASQTGSGASGLDDAIANVQRYLDLVASGRSTSDGQTALRGANLLTTVNKGIGDLVASDALAEQRAFAVMRDAIAAAKSLRADIGMSF